MLAIVGYIGAGFSRAWAVAQRNPALKWALVALCLVVVVEVVGELGLKVWRDLSEARQAANNAAISDQTTAVSTMRRSAEDIAKALCANPKSRAIWDKANNPDDANAPDCQAWLKGHPGVK